MLINTEAELRADGFEILALKHIDSLYRFALYMAENESSAQDLVRNTYLKAYRSFGGFEEKANCKIRLLAILNDTLINTIRRDGRQLPMICPSEEEECGTTVSGDVDTENEVSRGTINHNVAVAMSELPIIYRVVILLADMEGISYEEIADIIGCPIETVVHRLCRGRRLLGRILQSLGVQKTEAAAS